jgi:hypothetical protein
MPPASVGATTTAILEVVRDSRRPLSPAEMAKILGIPRNTAKQSMARLASRGHLISTGAGTYSVCPLTEEGGRSETQSVTGVTTPPKPARVQRGYSRPDDAVPVIRWFTCGACEGHTFVRRVGGGEVCANGCPPPGAARNGLPALARQEE